MNGATRSEVFAGTFYETVARRATPAYSLLLRLPHRYDFRKRKSAVLLQECSLVNNLIRNSSFTDAPNLRGRMTAASSKYRLLADGLITVCSASTPVNRRVCSICAHGSIRNWFSSDKINVHVRGKFVFRDKFRNWHLTRVRFRQICFGSDAKS